MQDDANRVKTPEETDQAAPAEQPPENTGKRKQKKKERPPMTPGARRRRRRRIIRTILWVILLAAVVAAGIWYYQYTQKQAEQVDVIEYAQAVAMRGPLDVTVYGSGMIEAANQPNVTAETDGTVKDLRVSLGDSVVQGQVLAVLENKDLDEEIHNLEYALWEKDSEITAASTGGEVTSIKAPSDGRVMRVYAKAGDDALAVYREHGSVAILSTDGRMKVEFEVAEGAALALDETVYVVGEGFTRRGTVTELYMQGTRATVTILDDSLPLDGEVALHTEAKDGPQVGEGTLEINKPMAVSAFGGTVRDVRVREGDRVSQKMTLMTLEDAPNSLDMEKLRMERESASDALASAVEKRENLIITAPADGVVASVAVAEGESIQSNTVVMSILEGEEMVLTIAVDELDVVDVAEGQPVAISVDALPGLTLEGTVDKVAPVGTGSGGVSTYDVLLNFSAEGTGVRAGMNASGEVTVAHADDAIYVPVEALMTIGNETFVMVADSGGGSGFTPPEGMNLSGEGGPPVRAGADGETIVTGMDGQSGGVLTGEETGGGTAPGEPPAMEAGGGFIPPGGGTASGGDTASGGSGDRSSPMGDLSQEERAALRESMAQGGGMMTASVTAEGSALRAVTTGLSNDDYVQITSGLSAGEIVLYQSAGAGNSGFMSMMMGGGGGMAMTQTVSMPSGGGRP